MKHRIDPKIDCVFKALLGSLENRNLLIHFLNAVLAGELPAPVVDVDILNPFNDKEFLDDKLSVVDVKATDQDGRLYQIEIQLLSYRHLPARIAYTWADIYSQQLQSGQDYALLKPTYAIWLLAENLVPDDGDYAHHYKLRDLRGRPLLEHGGIWLLELEKFAVERVENEEQRWLKLFKEGGRLAESELPEWMTTQEMRQAMSTLKRFSDKDRDYHAYQARQNFLREQRTLLLERDEAVQERDQAVQERDQAVQVFTQYREQAEQALLREREQAEQALLREREEKAVAQAELERLRRLLDGKAPDGG